VGEVKSPMQSRKDNYKWIGRKEPSISLAFHDARPIEYFSEAIKT